MGDTVSDPELTSTGVDEKNEEKDEPLDKDALAEGVDSLERKTVAVGDPLFVRCDIEDVGV